MKWPEEADGILTELFPVLYPGCDRLKSLADIEKNKIPKADKMINNLENVFIEWL